jgi:hypothetical protein
LEVLSVKAIAVLSHAYKKSAKYFIPDALAINRSDSQQLPHLLKTTRLVSISPVTRRQLHHLQQLYIKTLFPEKVKVELLNHKKSDRRIIMQPG